jgi:alpha-L-fucosidase
MYQPTLSSIQQHPLPDWYDDAKFGIFIHYPNPMMPDYRTTRDVTDELTHSVTANGMKIGLYYSGTLLSTNQTLSWQKEGSTVRISLPTNLDLDTIPVLFVETVA